VQGVYYRAWTEQNAQRGPPDARVTKVVVTGEGGAVPDGFRVRGTDW
jgi:hypothetical protein